MNIINEFGHIVVYGDTNSGKTFYTKYLIRKLHPKKTFIYAGVIDQWSEYKNVFDVFDNIKVVVEECKSKKNTIKRDNKFIIVFDDFNKRINTQTNQDYLNLFTEGRHAGIRVINLAHHVQDIGPVVRNNARYIIFTKLPNDEIKRISELFYDHKFMDICKTLYDTPEYTVGVLDKRLKELVTDIAVEEDEGGTTEIVPNVTEIVPIQTVQVPIEMESYYENPEKAPLNYLPTVGYNSFSTVRKVSNRDFHDNSKNMFNTAINNESKIDIVQTNHTINIMKIKNEYECTLLKDKEETRYLIRKTFKSENEIKKIIDTLNNSLNPKIQFSLDNYQEGCILFLDKFYNESYYPPEGVNDIIDSVGTLYENRNHPVNLLTLGYKGILKLIK